MPETTEIVIEKIENGFLVSISGTGLQSIVVTTKVYTVPSIEEATKLILEKAKF